MFCPLTANLNLSVKATIILRRKVLSEQHHKHTHQALKDICRFVVDSMLTLNVSLSYSQLVSNVLTQLLIVSLSPSKMFWLGG